jgi:hypothetical protein
MAGCLGPAAHEPVKIDANPGNTQIDVAWTPVGTMVHVRSPQGIGRATLTLPDGLPSGELFFRLDLAGLEQFEIGYDDTVVTTGYGRNGDPQWATVRQDGQNDTVVEPGDAFWPETRQVIGATEPYFVVKAPPDLAARQPATIELAWVDFYR